jgi:glucokinase
MADSYIGIDLGGTNVRVGWVTGNEIMHLEKKRVDSLRSEQEVIDVILDLIGSHSHEGIEGIGIGVPSIVDTSSGVVYDLQNLPGWEEVHLGSIVADRFDLPVKINNDANCFALGEFHFGKGRPFDSMIGLNIGTGFAGGIIIHGRLYAGNNCGAGEFGTIPFKNSMLEHYCGGLYFEKMHRKSGEKMAEKAARGDIRAMAAFREYGKYLGFAVKMILYSYDPEAIILGGSVSKSYPYFKESLMEELDGFSFTRTLENLTIDVSENEHIPILGAVALFRG